MTNQTNDFNILFIFKIIIASVATGVALLGVLARYLGRRKTPRPVRRPRKQGGRRTRNSMRSPNGNFNIFRSN